jgi:magnesium-transporting ATPase (P-type)
MFKKTEQFVEDYAKDGLRTLYLAERYLDEDEYYDWNLKSMQAKLEISDREAKVAEIDELIEINLELVGSTAIEDRLQDQVADSIQFMKSAGIKVWVLTGDKIETAMNIGVSAGLLDSDMDNHIIEETEVNSLIFNLENILMKIKENRIKGNQIRK